MQRGQHRCRIGQEGGASDRSTPLWDRAVKASGGTPHTAVGSSRKGVRQNAAHRCGIEQERRQAKRRTPL